MAIPRTRHTIRWIVLGCVALLLLLAADAAWSGLEVKRNLERARTDLTRGTDALIAGDVQTATRLFADAEDATARARSLLGRPAPSIGSVLPWIANDVRAVRRITDAASIAAATGTELSVAAERIGWQGGSLQGLSGEEGQLAGTLRAASADLHTAAASLHAAEGILTDTPVKGLTGPVRTALLGATRQVSERAELLDSASELADVLPGLFEPGRRYLLVIQNPAEPRGTGGFMGFFGFLNSQKGRLRLEELFPATHRLVDRPVHAPADYRARYARFDALVDLRKTNLTPDFPTAADVSLQMARQFGWGRFDGIVLVDPVWMKYMLDAIGPLDSPGWDNAITPENVVKILGHDVFLLSDRESDEAQSQIGTSLWKAIQTHEVAGKELATALGRAASERHMQLYSIHPEEQASLSRLGATGQALLGKNPLSVVWVGLSNNKAAWFAERSMEVDVDLADDGTATVTTTLHLTNHAPSDGPAGALLGTGNDSPIGTWASQVNVYQPEEIAGTPTYDSGPTQTGEEHEFGHPVSFGFLSVPPGSSRTWSVTYEAPDAVTTDGFLSEYRLDFLPQPTFAPIPLSIRIHLPDGSALSSTSAGMQVDGGTVSYDGEPTTPQSMWVRFS